jgi:hypothetical protein
MKTYTGGCHCGNVAYEVDTELAKVISCNCSRCHMLGLVLTFVPLAQFRLTNGTEEQLTDYRFNKKTIRHLFCPNCGVESFGRAQNSAGEETVAINVRCLRDVSLESLTITPVNGKDF